MKSMIISGHLILVLLLVLSLTNSVCANPYFKVAVLEDESRHKYFYMRAHNRHESYLKINFRAAACGNSSGKKDWAKCEVLTNCPIKSSRAEHVFKNNHLHFRSFDQALPVFVLKKDPEQAELWKRLKQAVGMKLEEEWLDPNKSPSEVYLIVSSLVLDNSDDWGTSKKGSVFFVNWDTALGNSNDQRNDQSVAAYYRVINGDALRNVRELVMGTVRASTEAPFNMPDRQPSNSMLLGALYHDWQTYRIGQVRLTSAHREKMAALVRHVQHIATENSEITIHILGFADKEGGSDLVNQAFSWARVRVCQKEILQYLRSVDSDIQNHIKISMYWYGNYASSRIFANYPNRELSYNRRIELIVSDKADWENVSRIRMFEKSWQSTEGHDRFDNLSVWPEPPWPKSIESEGLKFEELLLDHESNRGRPR